MKKKLPIETVSRKANIKGLFKVLKQSPLLLFLTLLFINALSFGQTTVFSDNFNRGAVVTPLTNGGTPITTYLTRSQTASGINATTPGTSTTNLETSPEYSLQLTPGLSFAARTYVTGKLSVFATPFNPILNNNIGLINWSFNIRTNRSTPLSADAFAAVSYGGAVILCTDKEDYLDGTAKGYIVYMSRGPSATTTNQLILARFSGGLTTISNVSTIASSPALGALTNYASVRVTFNPANGTWSLFVRDDGTTVFPDPSNVATQVGTSVVDQTHTGSTMTDFGFFWNHGSTTTPANNVCRFDNFRVSVNNPTINTPTPSSLTGFNYGLGSGPSAEQSFTLGGQFLSANLIITPPANYEISTGTGGSFVATNPITLTQTSGTVASTTIYVRLKAGLVGANYNSENITISSTGATSKTVECSGSVTTTPTISLNTPSLAAFANTAAGANSASSSFTASGSNLTGNITFAAPANFQVSLDNVTFSTSVSISPISGSVTSVPVYARYSPTGNGDYTGNIIATSSGSNSPTVSVSGYLNAFYYKTGDLATTTNWSSTANGSGTSVPLNFTTPGVSYYILSNATTTAPWTVAGTGSKIIVGDPSVPAVTLTVANTFAINTTSPAVLDITAASSGSNSVILLDAVTPTFGTMAATTEVHYQATLSTGITKTFGKLFVDGTGTTTTFTGTPIIQTSLQVAAGAIMATGNNSSNYVIINNGANVTINGTIQTQKSVGFVSSNVTTPVSTSSTLQFIGTENLTLGAGSTVVFNRASSNTAQNIDARSDYKNLTIDGLNNNKVFATGGTLGISGALTIGITGTSVLTTSYALTLTENSSIALSGTPSTTTLNFADSQAASWTAGKTLTITGWTGTAGATGTAGKIFFGSTASGLTALQLTQISFTGYGTGTLLLSNGELVPQNTLPVSLTSFTGKKQNTGILLNWSTASESNNQRFDILRSGADKNFQKIGEVVGNVNSSTANYYSFIDKNPFSGVNYYTLKQVDFDGKSQEYGPIAVTSDLNNHSLEIYSNSNQSEITVFVSSTTANPVEINVYDLSGRSMLKQTVSLQSGFNKLSLEASKLSKGVFLLKIDSNEGTLVKKFTY